MDQITKVPFEGGQTHLSPIRCDWETRAHFGISADDASQRRSSSLYKNSSLTPRPGSAPKFSTHPRQILSLQVSKVVLMSRDSIAMEKAVEVQPVPLKPVCFLH